MKTELQNMQISSSLTDIAFNDFTWRLFLACVENDKLDGLFKESANISLNAFYLTTIHPIDIPMKYNLIHYNGKIYETVNDEILKQTGYKNK